MESSEKNQYDSYEMSPPPAYTPATTQETYGFGQTQYSQPEHSKKERAPMGYQPAGYSVCNNQVAPNRQQDGTVSKGALQAAKIWFGMSIGICFTFPPLGIPAAVFTHKSLKAAKNGDQMSYLKNFKTGRVLASIGIGLSIALISNLSSQLPRALKKRTVYLPSPPSEDKVVVGTWNTSGSYIGCYKDDADDRDLVGTSIDFGDDNSVKKCVTYCSSRGYKYAGLQGETFCYCDSKYGKHELVEDSDCRYYCPAGDKKKCGGYFTNSIYRTNYVGCFKDESSKALPNYVYTMSGGEATPETCISECAKKEYEFAGVQNGDECHCGNDPNRHGEAADGSCNVKCSGDNSLFCGGDNENSVYKTDYNNKLEYYDFIGCYDDDVTTRDLDGDYVELDEKNNLEKCVEVCGSRGYKYAGLQFEKKCFCGNEYGKYTKLGEDECKLVCNADYSNCTGSERNTILRTHYFGCYTGLSGDVDALGKKISIDKSDVSPDACISQCEELGYQFAGVQNGGECYCGQDPNRYAQVPDASCDMGCTEDSQASCGSSEENSVYKTKAN